MLGTGTDAKTIKGEPLGYSTAILYLAPADTSGSGDVCPKASDGCKASCLGAYAGRVAFFSSVMRARVRKARLYFDDRSAFAEALRGDIKRHVARASRRGMKPAIRINGSSDLPQLARKMAQEFPEVQFYDYTKIPKPWLRELPNYRLTFSRSEDNEQDALAALEHGVNVAVVFSGELPKRWKGYLVIDGDEHDLRFLDERGVVVGLKPKGKMAKRDNSGFVVIQ